MARLFDISTTSDVLTLDAGGQGKLVFTVTNTTTRPQRATLKARALDSGQAAWLKIGGEAERDFPPGFTHQVELDVKAPGDTPPGRFRARLDALSVVNPEEDFTEGPALAVVVPAPAPKRKQSLWWVWAIVGGVVLIVIGAVVFLMMKPEPEPQQASTPAAPAASAPATPTPTPPPARANREFNDPRIAVGGEHLALDICREWAANCGAPAADAFCRSMGLSAAVDFRVSQNSPPTAVISTKQVCRGGECDRITWVACSPTPIRVLRLNRDTELYLSNALLRGKDVQLPQQ